MATTNEVLAAELSLVVDESPKTVAALLRVAAAALRASSGPSIVTLRPSAERPDGWPPALRTADPQRPASVVAKHLRVLEINAEEVARAKHPRSRVGRVAYQAGYEDALAAVERGVVFELTGGARDGGGHAE